MKTSTDGFAMADALIALIITALFSTSLLLLGQTTLRATEGASMRFQATLLARGLIETTELDVNQGEVKLDGNVYHWQKQVRSANTLSSSNRHIPLLEVEVSISWAGFQAQQDLSLTVHKLRRPS